MLSGKSLLSIARTAFSNGLKAIQLREKDLSSQILLDVAKKLRIISLKYSADLIVNDRLDIAVLSMSNGLHSTANGLKIEHVKRFVKGLIVGKSVHSLKQATDAEKAGYDYILYGPVFRTPDKIKYGSPQGIVKLKRVCGSVSVPVFAVGGINPARAKKCIAAGAYGVAVISALMKSENIKKTVTEFKNAIGEL